MPQPEKMPALDRLNEDFLVEMFAFAEHSVFLSTLPNDRSARGGSRHERLSAVTRETLCEQRDRVISKYDREGQGLFFCVSALDPTLVELRRRRVLAETGKEPSSARSKESVGEIVAAHVDIDLKGLKLGETDVSHRLMTLRLPPSAVIYSGNGVHAYWFLTEAIEATPDMVTDHEALLARIAFTVGGDRACCEVARLMRVPGSHNTKFGAFKPVNVMAAFSDYSRRYEFDDLIEFFEHEPPVILEHEIIRIPDSKTGQLKSAAFREADNPFAAYVRAEVDAGRVSLPPIDVERMLACMTPGDGEFGVHVVSRTVTASLVSRGWTADEIVPFVIGGIEAMIAANGMPAGWSQNWRTAEEKKVFGQIQGFERKQSPEKLARARERRAAERPTQRLTLVAGKDASQPAQDAEQGAIGEETAAAAAGAAGGNVVQFKINRLPRGRPKKEADPRGSTHSRLARITLEHLLQESHTQLCFYRGELWIYDGSGIWRPHLGKDQNTWIETQIHAAVTAANKIASELADEQMREAADTFDDDAKLRTEVRRYIATMPALHFDGEWDSHGLVPLANGLFDPLAHSLTPYAPEHRATYRFQASFDPSATFTHGETMIRDLFAPYGPETDKYVWLFRQFAYVALFKVGRQIGRQLRRCLYLLGEQNSGKSQLVDLLRSAIGGVYCSATTLDEMSDPAQRRFALEGLMGKALWAADEAANERTRIDAARVKALLAEDIVKTDAKGKKAVEARFLASAVFSSNSYPRTLDSASGFSDRFMLVRCPASFDNENPVGVALVAKAAGFPSPAQFVAATEMAGFLIWALGARDFIERERRFEQPLAVVAAREEIADRSNPVRAFVKECIETTPLDQASKSVDIYEAYKEWHAEDHGNKTYCLAPKTFWTSFNSTFNGRRGYAPRSIVRDHGGSLVIGVKLNTHALDFWRAAFEKQKAGDKTVAASLSGSEHSMMAYLDVGQIAKAAQYFGFEVAISPHRNDRSPRF